MDFLFCTQSTTSDLSALKLSNNELVSIKTGMTTLKETQELIPNRYTVEPPNADALGTLKNFPY